MRTPRRLLLAAALVMPVTTVTAIAATSGIASASTTTCTINATVAFAAPGLTQGGTDGGPTAKVTSTSVTGTALSCTGGISGSGSLGALSIISKSTKCKGPGAPVAVCAAKGDYAYGSIAQFATAGSTLTKQKAIKKLKFTINGVQYESKTSAAQEVVGGSCGSEVGFELQGSLLLPKALKHTNTVAFACLGNDSGPNTTGNFGNDLGVSNVDIQTATIDVTTSTLTIG